MNVKQLFLMVALLALPLSKSYSASNYSYNYNQSSNAYNGNSYNNTSTNKVSSDDAASMKQIRTTLSELKHQLNNHEAEIRTFENKLNSQETILDHVNQQLTDSVEAQQEHSKAQIINIEGQLETLDSTVKGLIADLRLMKTQANESVSILSQYKQKLSDFEKLMDAQNQHMKNLEAGLNSIMEVLQAQEAVSKAYNGKPTVKNSDSSKTYKVQAGDSLEKVARSQKVSVQAIRDLNNLKQDRIFVGQTLKIP